MLKKTRSLILTFRETTHALAAEKLCTQNNLPGRLIPVPREITADCGLAWKSSPESRASLCSALDKVGIIWADSYILDI